MLCSKWFSELPSRERWNLRVFGCGIRMSKFWRHWTENAGGTHGYLIIKIKIILEAIAVCARNENLAVLPCLLKTKSILGNLALSPKSKEGVQLLCGVEWERSHHMILRSSSSFGAGAECSNTHRFAGDAGAYWTGLAAVGATSWGPTKGATTANLCWVKNCQKADHINASQQVHPGWQMEGRSLPIEGCCRALHPMCVCFLHFSAPAYAPASPARISLFEVVVLSPSLFPYRFTTFKLSQMIFWFLPNRHRRHCISNNLTVLD